MPSPFHGRQGKRCTSQSLDNGPPDKRRHIRDFRFAGEPVARSPNPTTGPHLSDFELGLVLSAFLWVYTILQPVAGLLTDRFGARASLFVGGLATSVLTLLTGFTNSFLSLFAVRTLIGVTQAPNFVSGAKVTASGWYREEERARATSIWIAGGRLGPVLAFPLAAWLGSSYGWPWVFFVTGLMGILWCAVWYVGFEDNPKVTPKKD